MNSLYYSLSLISFRVVYNIISNPFLCGSFVSFISCYMNGLKHYDSHLLINPLLVCLLVFRIEVNFILI
uniref:Uncharacterized protein n=1 Tax=Anguilla anguilla TaxID=7936 RepID=A0A0E9PCC3_ANGAN